jgi:hypothetical protein
MAGGRKTKYLKKYCDELIEHMRNGDSYSSFAAKIGVHVDTLYEWEKVNPEFSEAKKVAFTHSLTWWEDLGKKLAMKSPAAYKYQMANRHNWTSEPVKGNDEERVIQIVLDPEDLLL